MEAIQMYKLKKGHVRTYEDLATATPHRYPDFRDFQPLELVRN
jgi:hypothetical protein